MHFRLTPGHRSILPRFIMSIFVLSSLLLVSVASAEQISEIIVQPQDAMGIDEFSALTGLKRGDDYSLPAINEAVKVLYRSGDFEEVTLEQRPSEKGQVLLFSFVRKRLVASIAFSNNSSVNDAALLASIDITIGAPLQSSHGEIERRIAEIYRAKGFFEATCTIEERSLSAQHIQLKIAIHEGPQAHFSRITTQGLAALPSASVFKDSGVEEGAAFNEESIHTLQQNLLNALKQRGFFFAEINKPLFVYDPTSHSIAMHIVGRSGKRVTLEFKGNDSIKTKTLSSKVIVRNLARGITTFAREGIATLKNYYKQQGFPFVDVAVSHVDKDDRIDVSFAVEEGERYALEDIAISGVSTISSDEIKDLLQNQYEAEHGEHYYFAGFLEALNNIAQHYRIKGYPDFSAKVENITLEDGEATIAVAVQEGQPLILKNIKFLGTSFFTVEEISALAKLTSGTLYQEEPLKEATASILEAYQRRGFIEAAITPKVEISGHDVQVTMSIHEGSIAYVGDVRVEGNEATDATYILAKLNLAHDDPIDLVAIAEAKNAILQLGLFTAVEIIDLGKKDADNHHDLLIRVKEANTIKLSVGTGIGTQDNGGVIRFQDNRLKVFSELNHNNLLRSGKIGFLYAELSRRVPVAQVFGHKLQAGFISPNIYRSPYDLEINVLNERQDQTNFDFDRFSITDGLSRNLSKRLRSTLRYEFDYFRPFNIDRSTKDGAALEGKWSRLGSANLFFFLDHRNDKLNPSSGSYSRITFSLFQKYFASVEDFYKVEGRQDMFASFRKLTGHIALRGGHADVFGAHHIPPIEQFYLGGTGSMRGFKENALTADPVDFYSQSVTRNSYYNYLAELIFPVYNNFKMAVFQDGGAVMSNKIALSLPALRQSAGLGVRYQTPIGPLNLDYGVVLDRKPGEDFGQFHFSIGFFI